jgi:GT2 family glycosyltransferase
MNVSDGSTGGLRASVLIPSFNRLPFLRQTLASLEFQSVPADRFEVIIAVDGSTDGTAEALALMKPHFPLKWVVQVSRGPAAARNAAARLAQHELLIFLDDDQITAPGLVAAHLAAHERDRNVLVQGAYPLAPRHDSRGASMAYERSRLRKFFEASRNSSPVWLVWGGNFSVSRQTWQRVGGFDESFRGYGGEDTDFGLRAAAAGVPVVFEAKALSFHLHAIGYEAFRNASYSEGRAVVRLAQRYGLPMHVLFGGPIDRPLDRALQAGWRVSPWTMDKLGRVSTAGLWLADRTRIRPLQLGLARMVRRMHKLGGVSHEQARLRAGLSHQ